MLISGNITDQSFDPNLKMCDYGEDELDKSMLEVRK